MVIIISNYKVPSVAEKGKTGKDADTVCLPSKPEAKGKSEARILRNKNTIKSPLKLDFTTNVMSWRAGLKSRRRLRRLNKREQNAAQTYSIRSSWQLMKSSRDNNRKVDTAIEY